MKIEIWKLISSISEESDLSAVTIKSCSRPLLLSNYTVLLIYTEIFIFVVTKSVDCLPTTIFNTVFRVILCILVITLVCLIMTPSMVFDYACQFDSSSSELMTQFPFLVKHDN